MDEKPTAHGYDISDTVVYSKDGHQIKSGDLAALKCPLCELVLRGPVQVITCGHRFCKGCLDLKTSASDGLLECPVDGEVFEQNEIRKDNGCFKEIQSLIVDCPTKPLPCPWRGQLTKIEEHSYTCPKKELACSFGCGSKFPRSEKESHAEECPKRPINCDYCSTSVPCDVIEDHYRSCEGYPVSCDFCKKSISSRKKLGRHFEDECTEYEMNCPFNKDECAFKGKKPQMVQHVQENHMLQSFEKIVKLEREVVETRKENKQLRIVIEDQKQTIGKFENRLQAIEKFITSGAEMPDMVEADCAKLTTRGAPEKLATIQPLTQLGSRGGSNKGDHLRYGSKLATPTARPLVQLGFRSFRGGSDDERDSGGPKGINATVSKLCEDVTANHSQVVRVAENVQSLQETMTRYSIAIDEIRLRQDVLDVKTTNGRFTWKIPEVRRRYGDAVERRTVSLYSPPFYTSPHGYRMCIRVYLNGDGIGKGTHISVFFVLMRSEHDNLLTWPFKQSVRFTLVNQVNPEASISEAFVPDLQSPSFQKPDSEMNIASGFPKFAKQAILNDENFTLGNTVFIKAQVDLTGLNFQ